MLTKERNIMKVLQAKIRVDQDVVRSMIMDGENKRAAVASRQIEGAEEIMSMLTKIFDDSHVLTKYAERYNVCLERETNSKPE